MDLSTGHPPSDLWSFQLLGLRTRVSHAATVRVHTKKYLWAERWGERRREFGRRSGLSVTFAIVGSRREEIHGPAVDVVLISLSIETPLLFLVVLLARAAYLFFFFFFTRLSLFFSFPRLLWPTMIFCRLHY